MKGILKPYRDALHGVDRRVYLVVCVTLVAVASRMSVYTFLGLYLTRDAGFTLGIVGLAFLAENIVRGVVGPFAGALSDRAGRRVVIVGSALCTAAALPLFLLVGTPAQLIVWSMVLGAAQAGSWPATSALLLDLSPPERRQSVLSLNYTAISVGYTLGVAPAGFLIGIGFPTLAAAGTLGFLGIALLVTLGIRGPLPATRSMEARSFFADVSRAPRDPPFLLLAGLGFIFPLGIGLIATVTPLYGDAVGLDEASIGLALAVNGPLLAILAIPVAARIERYGPYRFLPISAALLALSFLPLALASGFGPLVLASVVFTAGELVFSSALPTAVASLAPPGLRGAYQGAWALVFSIGMGAAIILTGVLRGALDWRATWLAWSVVTGIVAIGLALARPTFRRLADARAKEEISGAAPSSS